MLVRSSFLACFHRRNPVYLRALSSAVKNETLKPYYITTPIFYPNAVPHIGHLYSLVTADIFARFERLSNPQRPVHFLAGTDEHGLKIQKAAKDNNLDPKAFCDRISAQFHNLAKTANISNTRFMRTTEREHHEAVEHVWRKIFEKGLIYKGSYEGWYSVSDECFYTDSQVTRIPPTSQTSFEKVISTETGSVVEWQHEQNYMFRLSSFRESLLSHYQTYEGAIFPEQHHKYIVDILSAPLEDLSISRPRSRLSWGVPVPGDPGHTIYVWFDALIVYLSGIGYPWSESKGTGMSLGWPPNLQIIGKDILRFHAIYFPAMLQALGLPPAHGLLSHAHWTVNQKKMSKSVGNVADPFEAMGHFGADIVRYYLARVGGRFRDDVDWSNEQLVKYDEEIQSYVGNFLMRVTSARMTSRIEGAPPRTLAEIFNASSKDDPHRELISAQADLAMSVASSLRAMEVADALQKIVDILRLANSTMTTVAPWAAPPDVAQASYVTLLETLRICGICLQPFIPSVADRLLDALGVPVAERVWEYAVSDGGEEPRGKVGVVTPGVRLFEKRDKALKN